MAAIAIMAEADGNLSQWIINTLKINSTDAWHAFAHVPEALEAYYPGTDTQTDKQTQLL